MHLFEGSVPAAIPLDRKALAVCENNYGPDSACTGAMLAVLGSALPMRVFTPRRKLPSAGRSLHR